MTQDRLSGLDNATRKPAKNVGQYSKFIKFIKITLPMIALGVIGLLVLWPQFKNIETVPLTKEDITALKQARTENTLLNPIFNTVDLNNKPVKIQASEARQNKEKQDEVFLKSPSATFQTGQSTITFQSEMGSYNQSTRILELTENVVIVDSENNILQTQSLIADIGKNIAYSNNPSTLRTSQGIIEGAGVIFNQQNQTTIFQGPAKAVINP